MSSRGHCLVSGCLGDSFEQAAQLACFRLVEGLPRAMPLGRSPRPSGPQPPQHAVDHTPVITVSNLRGQPRCPVHERSPAVFGLRAHRANAGE